MTDTVGKLIELIRLTSTSLPEDVERAISAARRREARGSPAAAVLGTILANVRLARRCSTPICQDTGTLTFFVGGGLRRRVTRRAVEAAVRKATALGYLRQNCIDPLSGFSHADNVAEGSPVIHYAEGHGNAVTLIMKGGGSENMSRQYSLPDVELGAGRDAEGVRKCILDAVHRAKGYGCAPGILGVCIGGDRATGYAAAKEALLLPLADARPRAGSGPLDPASLLAEANATDIGPMGLGGRATLLGLSLVERPRLPASYFVTIAYMCWALRRRTMEF